MAFLQALFWEFVQNLPLVVFFVAAVWLWAQGRKRWAVVCMLSGSVVGSLLIRFTEADLSGYEEPLGVTIVNVITMTLLMIPFTIYLASDTERRNIKVDIVFGGGAGVLLGVAQGLAAPDAPLLGVIIHSLAFGLAVPLVLISIRTLRNRSLSAALIRSTLIAAMMTVVISVVDYIYLVF